MEFSFPWRRREEPAYVRDGDLLRAVLGKGTGMYTMVVASGGPDGPYVMIFGGWPVEEPPHSLADAGPTIAAGHYRGPAVTVHGGQLVRWGPYPDKTLGLGHGVTSKNAEKRLRQAVKDLRKRGFTPLQPAYA